MSLFYINALCTSHYHNELVMQLVFFLKLNLQWLLFNLGDYRKIKECRVFEVNGANTEDKLRKNVNIDDTENRSRISIITSSD